MYQLNCLNVCEALAQVLVNQTGSKSEFLDLIFTTNGLINTTVTFPNTVLKAK